VKCIDTRLLWKSSAANKALSEADRILRDVKKDDFLERRQSAGSRALVAGCQPRREQTAT